MKWISIVIVSVILASGIATAMAQGGSARAPAGVSQIAQNNSSPAQAALDQSTATGKYVFIFFWKEKNQQGDKVWGVLQNAATNMANQADTLSVQISDPAEKKIVDHFGVSRAPMPLVLAVAPCGAVTKAFTGTFDENQLRTAFVSLGAQQTMKALQDSKLALLCVIEKNNLQGQVDLPKGVQDFKADNKYGPATEIVVLNADDPKEAAFLKDLKVEANAPKPAIVLIAPPASIIGQFDPNATKEQIVAKLASAQSNPCAGGKCGPGGCGPKK